VLSFFFFISQIRSRVKSMGHLSNRNVLLGVTGGIAAYKSAQLVRDLQEAGADVRVVMSRAATEFITPMTLQALSGHPVHLDLLDSAAEAAMGHIELARWADLVVVAPTTADFMARLAAGRADDLLATVCLASDAPKLLAPAMNQAMWRDPATGANASLLQQRGFRLVGPAEGVQACGDTGTGRMEEPATIARAAAGLFESRLLDGLRVVVTAGPTREAIDPVRYISNHSSGKMGYAIARAAAEAGARTLLISGPVELETPDRVERVDVMSAVDMYDRAMASLEDCDVFIACAAVADYRPGEIAGEKIKKSADTMNLALVKNPDIVAAVAAHEQRPFTVGFAAETSDLTRHARDKLERKKLDLVVANDVSGPDGGFNSDSNAAILLWPGGEREVPLVSKQVLADELIREIARNDFTNRVKS
jgi:phosphopantothenoylcysteine decarboxylase/phosphopantothenate--cysteine ligase